MAMHRVVNPVNREQMLAGEECLTLLHNPTVALFKSSERQSLYIGLSARKRFDDSLRLYGKVRECNFSLNVAVVFNSQIIHEEWVTRSQLRFSVRVAARCTR